jgi:hypothetical protein
MTYVLDAYWDRPDPALPACDDLFSIFAFNEASLIRMEEMEMCQEQVADIRRAMDLGYRRTRRELLEVWLHQPLKERRREGFLKEYIPQLMFWQSGDKLDGYGRDPWERGRGCL